MGTLTACLKKAGPLLKAEDRSFILNRAAELRRDGMSAKDAGVKAVEERLAELTGMLGDQPGFADPTTSAPTNQGADDGQGQEGRGRQEVLNPGGASASPTEDATHKEAGSSSEPVTPAVVARSLVKAADNRDRKPSEMKRDLLRMVDEAMPNASDEYLPPTKEPTKKEIDAAARDGRMSTALAERTIRNSRENQYAEAANRIGFVTFKVPGDGTFKVLNTADRLKEFRAKVEASAGFKDSRSTTQPNRVGGGTSYRVGGEPFGVERGSGGPKATIQNMVDDGDPQAAVDFAAARGLDINDVLNGDKARLSKVAGLEPTAEAVGEFEAEDATEPAALPAKEEPSVPALTGIRGVAQRGLAADRMRKAQEAGKTWAVGIPGKVPEYEAPSQSDAEAFITSAMRKQGFVAYPIQQAKPAAPSQPEIAKAAPNMAPGATLDDRSPTAKKVDEMRKSASVATSDAKPIADVGEKIGGARKDTAFSSGKTTKRQTDDTRPAWARRFQISQSVTGIDENGEHTGPWVVRDLKNTDFMGNPRQVGRNTYATKEEAEAVVPLAAVALKHRPVPTSGGKYEIWREITDRKRVKVVDRQFDSRDEAMAYMLSNAVQIIETNTTFGESDMPLPPDRERRGPERRTGNVTGEDFKSQFGFRGIEFGNWNNQDERQSLMNDAWDGLMDLADVLGVPPKALGLNGDLALAFGARGQGLNSARAHYERTRAVINLTKEKGAGSLAHEWFHAMDHYFGRHDGKAAAKWEPQADGTRTLKADDRDVDYVSHGFSTRSAVRPELRAAYDALIKTLFKRAETYVEDVAKVDKFTGSTKEELARELDKLRKSLSEQKDPKYWKRNNKPASAEQLAEFDRIAKAMVDGDVLAVTTDWRTVKTGKDKAATRWTNDSLERLSGIYKEVRGRSGFDSTNRNGILDNLRGFMTRYSQRLKMLADAQSGTEKTKMVPTDFAMNAKELDQGRGGDYWTTPHEMAARAFQGYVEDKIAERGGVSRFLNYGPANAGILTPWGFKRPFPTGDERKAINAALDKFVGELKTREDDAGNVALFSRAGTDKIGLINATARELAKSGIQVNVADTVADLPQELRAAFMSSDPTGKARGAYFPGVDQVWLVAENLSGTDEMVFVTLHEAFHRGLHVVMGEQGGKLLRELYGMNKRVRDLADAQMSRFGIGKEEAINEALADLAGSGEAQSLRLWGKLVTAVRAWLRKIADAAGVRMDWTDNDVLGLVASMTKAGLTEPQITQAQWRGEMAMASRSDDAAELVALKALSQNDELFAYKRGVGTTLEEVAKSINHEIKVIKNGTDGRFERYTLVLPKGNRVGIKTRKNSEGETRPEGYYGYSTEDADPGTGFADRPGKNPDALGVRTDVIIDASTLNSGSGGSLAYAVASDFAHNIGGVFIGDPSALSSEAVIRRTENMLSSALKWGTTDHIAPHPRQIVGMPKKGVPPLRWDYAQPLENIRSMIDVVLKTAENRGTDIFDFDLTNGQFKDTAGQVIDRAGIEALSEATDLGRAGGAGGSTLARLAVLRSLVREQGSQTRSSNGQPDGLLAKIGRLNAASPAATEGLFYSRAGGTLRADALASLQDLKLPAGYRLGDFLQSHGKLSWWDKTVGTMHNLAKRNALFRPVYERATEFLNDVSYYATEAADLAPTLLPKMEALRDITKQPVSAEDTKAVSSAIFEGTLNWTRDTYGQPVEEPDVSKAGIRWTDDELRSKFKLNPQQIGLYHEFRAAVDRSIKGLSVSDILAFGGRDLDDVRERILAADSASQAARIAQDHLAKLAETADAGRAAVLTDTGTRIGEKAQQTERLIERGYAPLMRFGHYTVDAVDKAGERIYFGLFESQADANRFARKLGAEFKDADIRQGTMSDQAYQMFSGVSPETVELFGNMLGLESQGNKAADAAFQEYLKLAKSNRSAMKRMIQRKGVEGYSEDAGRVLAGFVYSNARQTSKNLHLGKMAAAVNDIAEQQGQGELLDVAVKLHQFVSNPQEEAQKIKGLLFAQYLGGSLAAGMVNLSQTVMVSFPYLTQFTSVMGAARAMTKALKDAGKWELAKEADRTTGDKALDAAIRRAEEEGTISPQEVHSLMAQASGRGALKAGDGTLAGDAAANAHNALSKLGLLWGRPFAMAEQFNRRATFIAAYRLAVEKGMDDPAGFAKTAIDDTQFVYTKASRPQWARGAVGSVLFTFKTYSISYVELLKRMAANGPEGRKAALVAVATLVLMSGIDGLPGAGDMDDLIDGFLQHLGYNFSSKRMRQEFLAGIIGEDGAKFVTKGVSGLPGAPIDVAGRLGLGNMIPGTGLLTKKTDHTQDVAELAGPAGSMVTGWFKGADAAMKGEIGEGAMAVAPVAASNVIKAIDMASTGMYRDQRGRKVLDVDGYDAMVKAIGFQPNDVARVQNATREVQRTIDLTRMRETEIADKWARGVFERKPEMVREARDELAMWNADNPEAVIRINSAQVVKRVKQMSASKEERVAKTAPKEIRAEVKRELEAAR